MLESVSTRPPFGQGRRKDEFAATLERNHYQYAPSVIATRPRTPGATRRSS
jgi:hypothetical protein